MLNLKILIGFLVLLAYIGVFGIFFFWSTPLEYLKEITEQGGVIGPLSFIILAALVVVIAPLTLAPIIPAASIVFGPFLAGLYTSIGWLLGSVVAFWVARIYGKPLVQKLISLEAVEKYEDKIPGHMEFWYLVLLRFVVQVDALSYALGIFSRTTFVKFTLATYIAMTPAAFVISYAGEALFNKDFEILLLLALGFLVIFSALSYLYYRKI